GLARRSPWRAGTGLPTRRFRPGDEPLLSDLYARSSHTTRYQRFFAVHRRLPPDWAHFLANVDYERRFALVLEDLAAPTTTLIGVARYEPTDDGVPEIAVVVEDRWQNKGLGTLLLTELFRAAADNGIIHFRAWVLADNRRMLGMLARHTEVLERRTEQGIVELRLAPIYRPRTVSTGQ